MLNKRFKSSEITSTGSCPLDCNYCYIPKTEMMESMHDEIVEYVRSGDWVDVIDENFQNLTAFSLWGTEPLLTLEDVEPHIRELKDRFPELELVQFSSSFCVDPTPIKSFKETLDELDIDLGVQVSADGQYTEVNRMEGATKLIKQNLHKLAEVLDTDLKLRWKSTIGTDNIKDMVENPEEIDKFFEYFEDIEKELEDTHLNFVGGSPNPTLVVPGKYTSENGKTFAKYLKLLREKGYKSTYTSRLQRCQKLAHKIDRKPFIFTCAGGDSNLGIDMDNIHLCHRTYYFDREEYRESLRQTDDYDNWDVSLLEEGILDMMNKWYIPSGDTTRFEYVLRNYHDYFKMKLDITKALLREFAECGQAEEIYKDDETLRETLALFLHTSMSCPVENLLNTGTMHIHPVSMIRLWCNGAFQELLRTIK